MKTLFLAKSRKTVRKFSKEKPPLESVMKALEVAKEAPSGMNAQPWHFVIVEDGDLRRSIRETCERAEREFYERVSGRLGSWLRERGFSWEKPFLTEAPYLVAVFGHVKDPFWIQSVWIAVGYMLLALEELGLGGVTYTPPNPRDVEKILEAPNDWRLQTIIPVGYPADEKPKYPRKDLKLVVSFNRFQIT